MLNNKKIKVALFTQMITLFMVCCIFFLNTQEVSAASPYYLNYAEPTISENSGYIFVEYASGAVGTFLWSAYSESEYVNEIESIDTGCSLVVDEQSLTITILTDKNIDPDITNVTTYYTISSYSNAGTWKVRKSGSTVDSNPTLTLTLSGSDTFKGFTYKGNVSLVTDHLDSNSRPIPVFGDDIVGQYIHDLYTLIGQNKNLYEVYLPKLNKIEAWESQNNGQLELLVSLTGEVIAELENIYSVTENIDDYITRYMHYLQLISQHLSTIMVDVDTLDNNVYYMKNRLDDLIEMLGESSASDKEVTDEFADNSDSQSDTLNDLNQQVQPNKPNIDNMSNKVDENLNVDIDANYGLLLSAFTGNNRILTMLLMVASVSLISYVLFGKR